MLCTCYLRHFSTPQIHLTFAFNAAVMTMVKKPLLFLFFFKVEIVIKYYFSLQYNIGPNYSATRQ